MIRPEELPDALEAVARIFDRDTAEVVEVILQGGTFRDVVAVIRRQVQGEQIRAMFGV